MSSTMASKSLTSINSNQNELEQSTVGSGLKFNENDSIYVLPKTYNGKTVTDLFPEFKYDSVLRFSKLFGVGRATSLPKIWKGTRKRKKPKSDNDKSFSNENNKTQEFDDTFQPVKQPSIGNKQDLSHNKDLDNQEDDVFKLFDNEFNNPPEKKTSENIEPKNEEKTDEKLEIKSEEKKDDQPAKLSPEIVEEDKSNKIINDELEFETDDEVAFLRPYIIDDLNKNNNQNGDNGDENNGDQGNKTWEYGPASIWYQMYDLNALAEAKKKEIEEKIKKLKKKEKKNKNTSKTEKDEEDEEEEEEEEDDEKEKKSSHEETPMPEQTTNDFEKINLPAINQLNNVMKDEKFLLVNTTNWEDNIIVDLNQTHISASNPSLNTNQLQRTLSTTNLANQTNLTNLLSNELINERVKYAGWVPSGEHRTLSSFQSKILGKKIDYVNQFKDQSVPTIITTSSKQGQSSSTTASAAANSAHWSSIFPNDNNELIMGDWENKIIIDPNDIDVTELKPIEFIIDPNDDNLLLGVPDEHATHDHPDSRHKDNLETGDNTTQHRRGDKVKLLENRSKVSKGILGKSGLLKDENTEHNHNENENEANNVPTNETKNFWNVSNDDYYNPKAVTEAAAVTKNVSTALVLQHTQSALELHPQFFPTHLSSRKLRNFHRLPLKLFPNSSFLTNEANTFNFVSSLLKKFKKQQDKPAIQFPTSFPALSSTAPSNDFVSIRTVTDLSALDDCQIILAEYSEQYPPLMMQPGMATKIRNYYKKKFSKDEGPQNFEFGELVYASSSPFLGALKPGEHLQALENMMFRAPIYKHKLPEQDFLIVRSRNSGYLIRGDIKAIFVVGQECPLIEVPGPNSKRANSFMKDFLQAYLVRLFNESNDVPKRIKMEDVKKAFPTYPENSIRKRLKICADFRRTGKTDTNWWILKEDVRLPTEEEVRGLVTPEQCCAYYSMLAAEQRLKDAGYGEKNLFASDDDDVDNAKIDDEVKNAPWHTTRAYLDAIKGKCLLQINGVADPTGRGEGFSYVRQAIKPNKQDEEQAANEAKEKIKEKLDDSVSSPQAPAQKRTVTGTDADLRRLHLSQAKELLASYGVPDHEIKKLKRWEIIDVVRTMSTQKAKEGNGSAVSKFARGNRFSQSDAHEKFRDECQRLFELQNRNLASEEYLSTDDDEELDEDSDVDEMGKNLESMLQNKMETSSTTNNKNPTTTASTAASSNKPIDNASEIKNIIMAEANEKKSEQTNLDPKLAPPPPANPNMQRVLKITRTYRDEDTGQEYTKVETVNKALVIDAYIKIRTTRDDEFIRSAFALDENEKEQLRKERRRLQEQLRRVKRNEAKRATADNGDNSPLDPNAVPKVRKYNKTGANRKPKTPKSAKFVNDSSQIQSENTNQSVISSPEAKKFLLKSSLHYSSGDEDRSQDVGAGGDGHSNMDTSSLNNTLTNAQPVVQKRKYQKRKKVEIDPNSLVTLGEAGAAGLTKVEGTKLIIQKKAIKLALNSEDGTNPTGDSASPVKKKYRTKKLKLLEANNSDLMVVDTSTNDANENNTGDTPKVAPKLKIVNKSANKEGGEQKSSIILHIPKEKLALSGVSTSNDPQQANLTISQSNDPNSSNADLTHSRDSSNLISTNTQNTPQVQQKRKYNKDASLAKKQQKLMMQQQQQQQLQLQQQLQQQLSQNPLETAAAAFAAAQFANLFENQQLLLALQQQFPFNANLPTPSTPDLLFPQNPLTGASNNNSPQLVKQTSQQSKQGQSQQQQQQQNKRKISTQNSQCDYLVKPHKKVDRRHADPSVSFSSLLEQILNELRDLPEAQAFILPVNSKKVPDYYKVVKNPIDLQKIRNKTNDKLYKNRAEFLDDMKLLVDNSSLYNGPNNPITASAEKLYTLCVKKIEEKQDQLARLEKAINPLLDDNSLIVFNYLLDRIYEEIIIPVDKTLSFLKPVNKAKYKDYYDIIKNPIDLETIKQKITTKKYKSKEEFLNDFELLYNNCVLYNGYNNSYTDTAQKLFDTCKQALEHEDYRTVLQNLEDQILIALHNQRNDDDHSNMSGSLRNSIDAYADSESNLAMSSSVFYSNESMDGQMTSGQAMLSMPKKIKPSNKKSLNNNNNNNNVSINPNNINIIKPISSNSNLQPKKNKRNLLSLGEIVKHKNSPKSGSDAEAGFVDVESIDDRMTGINMVRNQIENEYGQVYEEVIEDDNQREANFYSEYNPNDDKF